MRTCAVYGCKAGYKPGKNDSQEMKEEKGRSVFKFPDKEEDGHRYREWLKRINRAGFTPKSNSSGVCSYHFKKELLLYERKADQKPYRQKEYPRQVPVLAKHAIPTEHMGHEQVSYISPRALKEPTKRRPGANEDNQDTPGSSKLTRPELTLDDIWDFVGNLDPGLYKKQTDNALHIIQHSDGENIRVAGHLLIRANLSWKIFVEGKHHKQAELLATMQDVPVACVTSLTHVQLLLDQVIAFINLDEDPPAPTMPAPQTVAEAFECLEQTVAKEIAESEAAEDDKTEIQKLESLQYPLEQIKLLLTKPTSRRYSSLQLSTALMFRLHSRSGYDQWRKSGHIALPSHTTLSNITRRISEDTHKYLRKRLESFRNPKEAYVVLIQDEVSVKQGLELEGGSGRILGLTEEGDEAKKCLVFMVASLQPETEVSKREEAAASSLNDKLAILKNPREVDSVSVQALYYTAGFVVHAELKRCGGCTDCENLLIDPEGGKLKVSWDPNEAESQSASSSLHNIGSVYTTYISRGGLKHPSSLAFEVAKYCINKWCQIKDHPANFRTFLTLDNQDKKITHRGVFIKLVLLSMEEDTDLAENFDPSFQCPQGHSIVKNMCRRFFNCFMRCHLIQSKCLAAKEAAKVKADKLQSKTVTREK